MFRITETERYLLAPDIQSTTNIGILPLTWCKWAQSHHLPPCGNEVRLVLSIQLSREVNMLDREALKEFVKANPDMSCADVAVLFECSKQKVYHARHDAGVSKPVTMSKKKRLKVVRKSTLEDKDARIAELTAQVEMLKVAPNTEVRYIATPEQLSAVRKLEQELVASKAIITYLEGKLYGASV
jgi:hypothetical protein